MKKFSKLLALSLATALVFGMTVSAAPSPITSDGDIAVEFDGAAPEGAKALVAVESSQAPTNSDANKAIASENSDYEIVNVAWSGDVHFVDANGNEVATNGTIIAYFNENGDIPGVVAGKYFVVLHWNGSAWVPVSGVQQGPVLYGVFSSLSPVAIVEVDKKADDDDDDDNDTTTEAAPASAAAATGVAASPKTGETAPVAVLFAVASLGAAVVCSRKARYNK